MQRLGRGPRGSRTSAANKPRPCSRMPVSCGAGASSTALRRPPAELPLHNQHAAPGSAAAAPAPAATHQHPGAAAAALGALAPPQPAPAASSLAVAARAGRQQRQQQLPAAQGAAAAAMLAAQAPEHQQQQQLTPQQARLLTRHITRCDSWRELQQLLQAAGPAMNAIHVSAMLSRLGRLMRHGSGSSSSPQQAHDVSGEQQEHEELESFMQQLEAVSTRVMSVVTVQEQEQQEQQGAELEIWGQAGPRLLLQQQCQQPQHNSDVSAAGVARRQRHQQPQQVPVLPQQLSTMAWGWAVSGFAPGRGWWAAYWAASSRQLHAHSPQELATAVWAAGKLQQHPPATWCCAFEAASCRALAGGCVAPQEACMLAWGVAALRLGLRQPWWQALRGAAAAGLEQWGPRDLAQVLWAHARMQQLPPAPWLSQVLAAAEGCRARFSGRDAAMLLWALAALQVAPPPRLVAGLLQVLMMSNCKLAAAAPQDFAHILWALAAFQRQLQQQQCSVCSSNGSSPGQAHPLLDVQLLGSWARTTWHYTQPSSAGLSAADAAQLLWAASQLDRGSTSSSCCRPEPGWLQQLWSAGQQQQLLRGASSQALTVMMWSGLRLGAPPTRGWLLAAVPVLQQQLADLAPAGACQLLLVLARLQHRPSPAFMEQLLSRLQLDSHQLQPRAFACVLWALGRLGYQPGGTWWDNILQHLQAAVPRLGRREVANVVSGLAALQQLAPALQQQLQQQMEGVE